MVFLLAALAGFCLSAVTILPSFLTVTVRGTEGISFGSVSVFRLGKLIVLLRGRTFLEGATSVLSDSEKKIGAAFSFSEASAAFCGFWLSIEAMDAPSNRFPDGVCRGDLVADAGFGLRFSVAAVVTAGAGATGFVLASRDAVFSGVIRGKVALAVGISAGAVTLANALAEVSGFVEAAACAEIFGCAEFCGTGMIAVCGLTTNSGFGAGVTSRIEASPAVRTGAVSRLGVGNATAT